MKQSLEDKISEVYSLENNIKDLKQKLLFKKEQCGDLQLTVDKLQKTLEIFITSEEVQVYFD